MSERRTGRMAVLSVAIAIVGIFTPIAWDFYRNQNSLTLEHLSTLTLVEGIEGVDKLQVQYDGEPINTVSRLAFALVNTGRTPIQSEDIVSAPEIVFSRETTLLNVSVDQVVPEELVVDYSVNRISRTVQLLFPLLNSGDTIHFSVLLAGSPSGFVSQTRIAGIRELTFVDRTGTPALESDQIPVSAYIVGVFSALTALISLVGFAELRNDRLAKQRFKEGSLMPNTELPKFEFVELARQHFAYRNDAPKDQLFGDLVQLPDEEGPMTEASRMRADAAIERFLDKTNPAIYAVVFLLGNAALGFWYVLSFVV